MTIDSNEGAVPASSGQSDTVAVIGLGYVGLPLAVALSRKHQVVGFDTSARRIEQLRAGHDITNEVTAEDLASDRLQLVGDADALKACTIFIVTVPTPIDSANRPDFGYILRACALIGPSLKPGSIIVFESTVYPGATEEICGPALERASGLVCGRDFKLGYSPERINPGDRLHPIEKIVKVVAGQDEATLDRLADLYGSIIEAGIHRATSIKVAEAAKVIENTQRDVNIALMNEISKICDLMDIRSSEVLDAAATKWNFLRFEPGLVGGHCIGVDPYYLTAKAEQLGYQPEVILSGRRLNDGMPFYVANRIVKSLASRERPPGELRVGILGLTFKEDVPDIRNSKVFDLVREIADYGLRPIVHDPFASPDDVRREGGFELADLDAFHDLAALVLAVPHRLYRDMSDEALCAMVSTGGLFVDIKSRIDPASLRPDLGYWSL